MSEFQAKTTPLRSEHTASPQYRDGDSSEKYQTTAAGHVPSHFIPTSVATRY